MKLHKFISHFLVHAQEKVMKNIDVDLNTWKQEREEINALKESHNYNEIFIRRR